MTSHMPCLLWMRVFTDDYCSLSRSHVIPFCGCLFRQADAHPFRWMIFRQIVEIVVVAVLGNTTFTPACRQTPNIWGSWLCRTRRRTSDSYILGVAAHLRPLSKPGGVLQSRKAQMGFYPIY
jgi:hypothetical protein